MNITPKNPEALKLMRQSGRILQSAQEAMKKAIRPGIDLKTLDLIAEDTIRSLNGIPAFLGYQGFPATICAMINEEVVHAIPRKDRILKEGDLLSIDCGVIFKGLYSDAAFSVVVGGDDTHPKRAKFSNTVKEALKAGCQAAKAGNTLGDIGYAIQSIIEKKGYKVIRQFTGHGIGYHLHEEPYVFNYGRKGRGLRLKEGMTICIEPIIGMKTDRTKTLADGWTEVTIDGSDACQWEHCGVVTKHGLEIFA